jgi:hypothetical protein
VVDGGMSDSGAVLAHEVGHQLVSQLQVGFCEVCGRHVNVCAEAWLAGRWWTAGCQTAALCWHLKWDTNW